MLRAGKYVWIFNQPNLNNLDGIALAEVSNAAFVVASC
jgi:hypothetical protein